MDIGLTFLSFLLLLTRLTSFFLLAPLFSHQNFPVPAKIGLAAGLSLLGVSQVPVEPVDFGWNFFLLVLKEFLVGLVFGFAASIILLAIQMAGAMIDLMVGFALANLVDPQTGVQMPLIANFKYVLAVFFFLAIDGHHMLIRSILFSLDLVPLTSWPAMGAGEVAQWMVRFFQDAFLLSLQIALPMMGAVFLADLAMGLIARTVPQMNIFVVGFPLKLLGSFLMLFLVIPGFFSVLLYFFQQMFQSMGELLALMGGR